MEKILIFGACSAIAQETAKCFAKDGATLFLVDLSANRLETVKNHINAHFPTKIFTQEMNANDFKNHGAIIQQAIDTMGGLCAVLIAHGTLPDQQKLQENPSLIISEMNTNYISVISLLSFAANYFEKQGKGCLAAISSVAGDRGRQSNYIYGAAKGGISIFMQGLRNRMALLGIPVVTIKPGFVDTPMTAHLVKNPLYASAEKVGKGIYQAMVKGKDVVYLPGFWRYVMFIIKHIPESIFKKLKL